MDFQTFAQQLNSSPLVDPSFPLTQEELKELESYPPDQRPAVEAMIRAQVAIDEDQLEENHKKENAESAELMRELREMAGEPEPQHPQE